MPQVTFTLIGKKGESQPTTIEHAVGIRCDASLMKDAQVIAAKNGFAFAGKPSYHEKSGLTVAFWKNPAGNTVTLS